MVSKSTLYLERSLPPAGLQCSSGRRFLPSGAARAAVARSRGRRTRIVRRDRGTEETRG